MKDYTPQELEQMLQKFANDASKAGQQWAEQQGLYNSLHDRRDDFLAALSHQAEGDSNAAKERNARLTADWKSFKDSMIQAECDLLKLRIAYDTAVRSWETARSLLSSKNQERRTST